MSARIKPAPPPRVAQLVKALRESADSKAQEGQAPEANPELGPEGEASADSAQGESSEASPESATDQGSQPVEQAQDPRSTVKIVEKAPCDRLDDLSEVSASAPDELVRVVEGLIFAAPEALHVREAVAILEDFEPEAVRAAFKVLAQGRPGSGLQLSRSSKGYRWTTDPAHARYVQRLVMAKPHRLSRPQLETLAVIAYRQPVTRPEIDHIRGVDSAATLKALLERDLIAVVGQSADPGRPRLYGTTLFFLEYLNITELESLPPLGELRDLSERTRELLRSKVGVDEAERLSAQVLAFAQQEDAGLEPQVVDPEQLNEGDAEGPKADEELSAQEGEEKVPASSGEATGEILEESSDSEKEGSSESLVVRGEQDAQEALEADEQSATAQEDSKDRDSDEAQMEKEGEGADVQAMALSFEESPEGQTSQNEGAEDEKVGDTDTSEGSPASGAADEESTAAEERAQESGSQGPQACLEAQEEPTPEKEKGVTRVAASAAIQGPEPKSEAESGAKVEELAASEEERLHSAQSAQDEASEN